MLHLWVKLNSLNQKKSHIPPQHRLFLSMEINHAEEAVRAGFFTNVHVTDANTRYSLEV